MTNCQKQPSIRVFLKQCSENTQQIYRRTPIRKSDLTKLISNFIEITLWHGCSLVNLMHIFRTHFPKNTSGGVLLNFAMAEHQVDFSYYFKSSTRRKGIFSRNILIFRSSHRRCSVKKVFLEISQNSQENTCARVTFLIKLQVSGLQLY